MLNSHQVRLQSIHIILLVYRLPTCVFQAERSRVFLPPHSLPEWPVQCTQDSTEQAMSDYTTELFYEFEC